jgi:hypothetical protein
VTAFSAWEWVYLGAAAGAVLWGVGYWAYWHFKEKIKDDGHTDRNW